MTESNKIEEAAKLLQEASKLLLQEASKCSENEVKPRPSSSKHQSNVADTRKQESKRARKDQENKPFDFVLLHSKSLFEEEGGSEFLKKEMILERGMVSLTEEDSEHIIRQKHSSGDFDFVKVAQKRISVLRLGKGIQYDYFVVKKLAGQGQLYLRLKESVLLTDSESADDIFEIPTFTPASAQTSFSVTSTATMHSPQVVTTAPLQSSIVSERPLFFTSTTTGIHDYTPDSPSADSGHHN
eukprot:gene10515-11619_t